MSHKFHIKENPKPLKIQLLENFKDLWGNITRFWDSTDKIKDLMSGMLKWRTKLVTSWEKEWNNFPIATQEYDGSKDEDISL